MRSTELEFRPARKILGPVIGPLTRRARQSAFRVLKRMLKTNSA
jgi:hypothetical protein